MKLLGVAYCLDKQFQVFQGEDIDVDCSIIIPF